ncbi:MAG: hypothetical protein IIB77_09215, partial [Proteobacteria bacterium]|nr:hypothetical protein [Pseudomonadota bacterium]
MTNPKEIVLTHGPLKSACFADYVSRLSSITIDADGQVLSSDEEISEVITLGKKAAMSLGSSMMGVGMVMVYGRCDSTYIDSFGWIVSKVGEAIEQIHRIEKALTKCRKGSRWPLKRLQEEPTSISRLRWSLPFSPDREIFVKHMVDILRNSCSCLIDTESLNLGQYCEALDLAVKGGEIDSSITNAIRFSAEWAGFCTEIQ